MFWHNSGNAQISDVKMAIILIKFLMDGNEINQTIYLTINPLINCYFLQS